MTRKHNNATSNVLNPVENNKTRFPIGFAHKEKH